MATDKDINVPCKADYISREALREMLGIAKDGQCGHCNYVDLFGCKRNGEFSLICEALDDVPAADVVEVVRCKDCVNNCGEGFVGGTIACGLSNLFTVGKDPMDFCSYGRRRPDNVRCL